MVVACVMAAPVSRSLCDRGQTVLGHALSGHWEVLALVEAECRGHSERDWMVIDRNRPSVVLSLFQESVACSSKIAPSYLVANQLD